MDTLVYAEFLADARQILDRPRPVMEEWFFFIGFRLVPGITVFEGRGFILILNALQLRLLSDYFSSPL